MDVGYVAAAASVKGSLSNTVLLTRVSKSITVIRITQS